MDALINVNGEQVQALQILFITTLLTLLPSMVIMMTSFTRYVISFSVRPWACSRIRPIWCWWVWRCF